MDEKIQDLMEAQGWNDASLFGYALAFISTVYGTDVFADFLQEQADYENALYE